MTGMPSKEGLASRERPRDRLLLASIDAWNAIDISRLLEKFSLSIGKLVLIVMAASC